jgi:branched-chain amino acid aminotransferase
MEVPAFFSPDNILEIIRKLLKKNRIFGGARIRMTVFRNPGGLYAPEQHSVSFTMESAPLDINHYSLNPQGLVAGVFPEMTKHIHPLSSVKSTSALLYVMAGIYKTDNKLDDCILLNEKGHLVESGSSNIFLVKNRQIFTPGLSEGCLPGIMRQVIASCIKTANYHFSESIPLKVSDLMAADEVFLTNAISGIQWVGAIQQKRYYHEISGELMVELNRMAFGN